MRTGKFSIIRNVRRIALLPAMGFVLATASAAFADQSRVQGGANGVTWQAGVDGVEIEFGPDGKVKRIYSRYSHEVTMADRRGIRTATTIAEEKAKANIVRFMEQKVATGRVVSEVEATISKTKQERSDKSSSIERIDQRVVSESLGEVTASYAKGTLRGVVLLEQGYDEKKQEAWVVVGISEKTIRAARGVKEALTEDDKKPVAPDANKGPARSATPPNPIRQPSEQRRSKQDF
jgi:hypothetical protein